MIKNLLLDLDDTLLDFHRDEAAALSDTLRSLGIAPTEDLISHYSSINRSLWEALERGETDRESLLTDRFAILARERGLDLDPREARARYEARLSEGHSLIDGAIELLSELFGKYRLYLVSNGSERVQMKRLAASGLDGYFDRIYISEAVGVNKPDPRFFHRVFCDIPDFSPEETLIVGDSSTSDIAGGLGVGILTCRFCPHGESDGEPRPHYRIGSLSELPPLLLRLKTPDNR